MKKSILALAIALFSGVACASELWWMVDDSAFTMDAGAWDTARVYYFDSNDLSLSGQYGASLAGTATRSDLENVLDYAVSTANGNYSGKSFYIELYNSATYDSSSDHSDAFRSGSVSYEALVNGGAFHGGGTSYGASPYTFTDFTPQVIPEPTSGLLVLLGMMALGLKRKRG